MLAANDTYIDFVLNYIGLKNVALKLNRYPTIDIESLQNLKPQLCFLSSEPFPFKQKHVLELQQHLPSSKIIIVDGEVFSWYGLRMLHLEEYVKSLLPAI